MLKKLREWWQKFKTYFLVPVIKTVVITGFFLFVILVGVIAMSKISLAPKGFEHLIGRRVYQLRTQGMPWLMQWHPGTVSLQSRS